MAKNRENLKFTKNNENYANHDEFYVEKFNPARDTVINKS